MCSYNAINDDYACQNSYLLTDVLKKDWAFPGFVLSDWGGTHSTIKASAAGLDNEQPGERLFGDALKDAVTSGKVSRLRLMNTCGASCAQSLRTELLITRCSAA